MSGIDLVLTDDWELRGDGSGDMRQIQFSTLRTVAQIYEDAGFRGSFNAEVMQQLHHLREGQRQPHLLELAHEWDDLVRQTFANGHDVQLHMHPQWHGARYCDGRWTLPSDWTLGQHPSERIRQMLHECKTYLEGLLKPIDATYRCVSFRAGAWAIAPSPDSIPALIEAGIRIDTSIAPGMIKTDEVDVDYSQVRPELLPFYPSLNDARQVASERQPIVCVPTHTFEYTPFAKIQDTLMGRFRLRYADETTLAIRLKSFVKELTISTHYVSDLSALSSPLMVRMLDDIRRKHAHSGVPVVPVVLANHTKDLTDYQPIRRFAGLVATTHDIHVITLSQLAANIESGRYPVRTLAS